jgi:transposase
MSPAPFGPEEERIMSLALPDARELSDDVLEALRLRALRGCELGFTEADVADLLGVCRETVSRWWSAYARDGLDALPHDRTGRPTGTGRTLSDPQAQQIQKQLAAHSPEDLSIPAPLWTRRAVQQLIRNELGIVMPVRTVGLYLQRWGYTVKRPRRHAKKQDPEEIRRWLEETYPAIEQRAAEQGAAIHWCDETGVGADQCPARGYAPVGEPVTMDVPDPHIGMNQIATITNQQFPVTCEGTPDDQPAIGFLGSVALLGARSPAPREIAADAVCYWMVFSTGVMSVLTTTCHPRSRVPKEARSVRPVAGVGTR